MGLSLTVVGAGMSGFSGHGFKFGQLIGEAVAEALEIGSRASALSAWAAGGVA